MWPWPSTWQGSCGEARGCDQENFTIQKPCKKITLFWLFNIATENGPFIDGLPIKNGDVPGQTVTHNQVG